MSGDDPLGDENFDFNDLGKMFSQLSGMFGGSGGFGGAGADPWVQAEQLAAAVASDGGLEPNLDPIVRMAVEDLSRVAELHVRQIDGLALPADVTVLATSRSDWVTKSFAAYRPFFERFGEAIGNANQSLIAEQPATDPMGAMFSQMFTAMGPMMVSASAGSMIGHLAQRALGQYDLPIPRPANTVLVIPAAIDTTAEEWGVPVDELRLWVLVRELVAHAVLSTPHVAKQLDALFVDFASGFRPDPEAIQEQIGSITDLSQLTELSETLGDPEAILSMMRSPAQDLLVPRIDALVAAVLGYVDHVVDDITSLLVTNHDDIRRRMREQTIDTTPADRFMERLLGIDITESTLDRGAAFIAGVVERSGDAGLARLWSDELDLPTAAEVDAPGLWLARIGLDPDLPGGSAFEVPDDLSGLDDLDD